MAEYFDLNTNINLMVGTLEENNYTSLSSFFSTFLPDFLRSSSTTKQNGHFKERVTSHQPVLDKQLMKVRNSICIVGYNLKAIQYIKQRVASLVVEPLPLESLHISKISDLEGGTLMVPKVILVATHCPGKKLIDDDGNSGQLDEVYDKVCEVGADVLVIYLGLPRSIYPTVRHMVYHPRMTEIVFPTQPTLRSLAEEYSLITVLEKSELSSMQKNVIREWLMRPVGKEHPIYATSSKLVQMTFSDAEFWSESELYQYHKSPVPYHATNTQYASAYEYKSPSENRKSKKTKRLKSKKSSSSAEAVPVGQLIDIGQGEIELEMYNGETAQRTEGAIESLMV